MLLNEGSCRTFSLMGGCSPAGLPSAWRARDVLHNADGPAAPPWACMLLALLLLAFLVAPAPVRKPLPELTVTTPAVAISLKDLPFVFTPAARPGGGGGGGGGAHQKAPVPKAHGRGDDRVTIPVTRLPSELAPLTGKELPFQALNIPAKPLASGADVILGLPMGAEGAPLSRGPGNALLHPLDHIPFFYSED